VAVPLTTCTVAGNITLDRLRICMAAPGRPRPTDFSTAAGDKKLLTVSNRNRE
jgi:hypothetical protein